MIQKHKFGEQWGLSRVWRVVLILGGLILLLPIIYYDAYIAYNAISRFSLYYDANLWSWLDLLLVPTALAVLGLWFSWAQSKRDKEQREHDAEREKKQREHDALLNALQGEKEAVGFVAYQVKKVGLKGLKGLPDELDRSELIAPLCLAAVYEGSDRTRALVLSALEKSMKDGHDEKIKHTFYEIDDTFHNYKNRFATIAQDAQKFDIDDHLHRLKFIYTGLGIEPPSRS
jgi:hypothetical protein